MLKGTYRDRIHKRSKFVYDSCWQSNHIVESCDLLAATLFNNESGYRGVTFLAIGTGERSWDSIDKEPSGHEVILTNEVIRYPLKKSSISYIDQNKTLSVNPTNRLRVQCSIKLETIPGFEKQKTLQLREFALFGGDATEQKNSGQMIDYVIHPRIDLSHGVTLVRMIDLHFQNVGFVPPVTPRPPFLTGGNGKLVALPLRSIDGIGSKYEQELAASGITTIKQLAEIDPEKYTGTIPLARMNEFRSKATFSTRILIDPEILESFASLSIDAFVKTKTTELPGKHDAEFSQLIRKQQLELSLLESSFNTKMLKSLLLKDILPETKI